jgi:hypothetical protein
MKTRIIACIVLAMAGIGVAAAAGLQIKTDVAGVEVYLDDASVGQTPLRLDSVTAGRHELRLSRDGFLEASRSVEVPESGLAKVFVPMTAVELAPPVLPQTFHALHQHKAGVCNGTLTVTAEGIRYEADDRQDVFDIPWKAMTTVTRGMGSLPNVQWSLTGEYCGLRIDTPARNYGFLIYEETPEIAKLPSAKRGDAVTLEMASKPTGRVFDLVWRIWRPLFIAR